LRRALDALGVSDVSIPLERPRDPTHGDLATTVALSLAKPLKRAPRAIAEDIVDHLEAPAGLLAEVTIAGPGFINFRFAGSALGQALAQILDEGDRYGRSATGAGIKVNVEFVSANPTGPLHVGHGRGAVLGDAIASLLEATGHEVAREFYVNDAGVQIQRLAESLRARVLQAAGKDGVIPENGYHGAYLQELATQMLAARGADFADLPEDEMLIACRDAAVQTQREEQDRDLSDFGVHIDQYYAETQLYESNALDQTIEDLERTGLTYEHEGALWLRTTEYGDAKDRVLRKSDGTYTYFLPDLAYHRDKAERGFDRAIDVWGADHHGYVPRMHAAMTALGHGDFFHAVIVQLVEIMRDGKEVKFSKRAGNIVELRWLYEETGVDAARYFFLIRRPEAKFVFDVDLATKQSDDNPVYYVQYAHTRMSGIFRKAEIDADVATDAVDFGILKEPSEQELINRLADFPGVVASAAVALEPHRITGYLDDVARLVNGWYHHHRVLDVGEELTKARLVLARASQIVLCNGLTLLGVSAPERM
jgi:arginyl-tRNA synthetase